MSANTMGLVTKRHITPIETSYAGRLFRSRLEARWAVFFDELGISYVYEAQGFLIDGLPYLPDCWLPDLGFILEIKPAVPRGWPHHVGFALPGFRLLQGAPGYVSDDQACNPEDGPYIGYTDGDYGYYWCECQQCGAIGLEFEGRSNRLPCKDVACIRDGHSDKSRSTDTPRLRRAYRAAMSARFEHGENGRRQ